MVLFMLFMFTVCAAKIIYGNMLCVDPMCVLGEVILLLFIKCQFLPDKIGQEVLINPIPVTCLLDQIKPGQGHRQDTRPE